MTVNSTKHLNSKQSERGAVMVELAVIIPLIFVISFTVFEFTRAISRLTIATSASKEFANIVKRSCNSSNLNSCLTQERLKFEAFLRTIKMDNDPATDVELIVSYIRPVPAAGGSWNYQVIGQSMNGGTITAPDGTVTPTGMTVHGNSSKVASLISSLGNPATSGLAPLNRHKNIVFAECYIPFSPVITFINSIFNLPFTNGTYLYDSTII